MREVILESLKGRTVCVSDHSQKGKHDEAHDAKLGKTPNLTYGRKLGGEHKEVTELLEFKEVKLFLLEGKMRLGFHGRCNLNTLKNQ